MNTPEKILIIRTDRIGDVTLTLPMAHAIKKFYPGAQVAFLVREYTRPLAENNKYIDETLVLKEKNGKILYGENIELLKKFDACFLVHPTFELALLVYLSGIKIRAGTGYRWYSFLFNRKIYEHRKYAEKHELEFNLSMLNAIGINYETIADNIDFGLRPDAETSEEVKTFLKNNDVDTESKLIIIHPGSGGSSVDLPFDNMKRLVTKLSQIDGAEILITGSKSETELCARLIVSEKTKNLAGVFNLKELIALISLSDILIANSTGPIHIAAALNKFVVGFYPKVVSCSAERWGPYTDNKAVFKPETECNNCTIKKCMITNCMSAIDIDKVVDTIANQLSVSND
ncbi:glycosyl transferase, family 9 [Melioribacter roseus P3M-2]|uniref:Glycosyl transferase, family 9 n=1 Tax=Melioribacter roseus (strain DSM 23840 / JCM 17771 / VKM B-2668 / P3M-2) TaxID=1191523 RepID=I6YU95_MELRP|nr:glycosyltransferase family 9 protein [Melioribacter roseus]AFN74127.1 glycosyl transferase, family 9 [Melioribacter roseus P3M-2]